MEGPNKHRIAKNALYLYGRMMLTVGVSLYTSRVVLDTLGVANYGIYNLVGGIVLILGFLNGTMAGATARFLNFEMGRGNNEKLRRTFSTALLIHVSIALLVFLLAETVGLWFVNTHLTIAPQRMAAANITYQLSILAAMFTIVQIPYTASIMAHEHMNAYAVIAIVNVLLKLAVTLMLLWVASFDRLVVYAILMMLVALAVAAAYCIYSRRLFSESRAMPHFHRPIFRAMVSFTGWDIYGNLCFTTRAQGVIVVLNRFGGTVLNAAGNLTMTVSGTILSFAGSVVTAFRPQIIQQYAKGNFADMQALLNNCARYSTILLGLLVVPVCLEMKTLLGLWLKEVPPFTTDFCRVALIATFGELLISILAVGIHATGRVKLISFVSGTLYLLELPAMWFILRATGQPPVVYVIHCCFILGILVVNTLILKKQMPEFKALQFWWKGILLPGLIVGAAAVGAWSCRAAGDESFLRVILTAMASSGLLASLTFYFAFDSQMRHTVLRRTGLCRSSNHS